MFSKHDGEEGGRGVGSRVPSRPCVNAPAPAARCARARAQLRCWVMACARRGPSVKSLQTADGAHARSADDVIWCKTLVSRRSARLGRDAHFPGGGAAIREGAAQARTGPLGATEKAKLGPFISQSMFVSTSHAPPHTARQPQETWLLHAVVGYIESSRAVCAQNAILTDAARAKLKHVRRQNASGSILSM